MLEIVGLAFLYMLMCVAVTLYLLLLIPVRLTQWIRRRLAK
jgi:hypothetical protein